MQIKNKVAGFICGVLCFFSLNAVAEIDFPHIQVQGSGSVEVVPDTVVIKLSLEEVSTKAIDAKKIVDSLSKNIITVAKKNSIVEKDIQASVVQIMPQYEWKESERIYTGEKVSRDITLKLKDVEKYAQLLNQLVVLGGVRITSTSLVFSDKSNYEKQALKAAIENAKQKALFTARSFGSNLDGIYSITESNYMPAPYQPRVEMKMMAVSDSNSDSGLSIGAVTISANVTAVYKLKNM